MKAVKKPIEVDAHRWFKNGDHPDDKVGETQHSLDGRPYTRSEGAVVQYYRHPPVDRETGEISAGDDAILMGDMLHSQVPEKHRRTECPFFMRVHGWINTLEGGHVVCPGDWIITGVKGEHYPIKHEIFMETYDFVEGPCGDYCSQPKNHDGPCDWSSQATITDEKIAEDTIRVNRLHIAKMTACETCGAIKPINGACPRGCIDRNSYKFVGERRVLEVPLQQPDVVTLATPSMKVSTDRDGHIAVQPIYEEKAEPSVDECGNEMVLLRLDDLKRVFEAARKTWDIQGADEYHGPSNRIRRILEGEK